MLRATGPWSFYLVSGDRNTYGCVTRLPILGRPCFEDTKRTRRAKETNEEFVETVPRFPPLSNRFGLMKRSKGHPRRNNEWEKRKDPEGSGKIIGKENVPYLP